MNKNAVDQFDQLLKIMHRLRQECPWDRKQSHESLRQYILEEAYETVETIDKKNWKDLEKELGDLLLQIVFQSEIAEEKVAVDDLKEELIQNHQRVIEMDDGEDIIDAMQGEEEWSAIAAESAGPAYDDIDVSDEDDGEPSLEDLAGGAPAEEPGAI